MKSKMLLCFVIVFECVSILSFIKNKKIYELEYINNQLRLEYEELEARYRELEMGVCNER